MNKELPKAYDPQKYEDSIYKKWEESGFFNPDVCVEKGICEKDAETYTIVLPPPNITDKLHLGHGVMVAISDILIRYNRMNGKRALWIPGTDHAAIATQNVVEKKILKEEKKSRHDLGREKFLDEVNKFVEETQATIIHQLKKTGASLDWSREAFTLDEQRQQAVKQMFVDMYEAGAIYQGHRIVNWCPRCQSTLADDEVEYKEQDAKFYTFKYDKNFPFAISTTRPETKLGDTAVAVNPDDKKYKKYIGQELEANFCGMPLKLKIIADENVDPEFGTGALGVTPAHSMVDYEMAQKNNLEIKKVIDEQGKMIEGLGEFGGKRVKEARKIIIEKLTEQNLLEKEEDIRNSLSICYRCGTAIEPLTSKQWFVSVDKKLKKLGGKSLKEKAIEVAKKDEIKFVPERFTKRYLDWMENLHDWCISRQIWFGHQIPVWYKRQLGGPHQAKHFEEDVLLKKLDMSIVDFRKNTSKWQEFPDYGQSVRSPNIQIGPSLITELTDRKLIDTEWIKHNEIPQAVYYGEEKYCGIEPPKGTGWTQDPDVLDTWFSSGMWTLSTLGWPKQTDDIKIYHPTQVLETGYEIITLWVSRMIMMSLFAVGQIPFENVYLHGMVLDAKGKKMSKSKGNGIDPLEMIEKYGTDAVRMSLIVGNTPGNDMKMSEQKIAEFRNFANKLWNITRFILMTVDKKTLIAKEDIKNLTLADRWISIKLQNLFKEVTDDIENFKFSQAGEKLRDFTWGDFADWYIEVSKFEKNKEKESILFYTIESLLKLWHPFMPFVTETIWQEMGNKNLLMVAKWPKQEDLDIAGVTLDAKNVRNDFELIKEIITAIRQIKSANKIPPKEKIKAVIYAGDKVKLIESQAELIKNLRTGVEELEIKENGEEIKNTVSAEIGDIKIYILKS